MRKKVLTMTLVEATVYVSIVVLVIIALICSVIDQANTIKRYEAMLDTSCKRALDVTGCKLGIEALKKMSVEDIEKWGY